MKDNDRDRKVVEIVQLFLRSVSFYRRLYQDHQRDGLSFDRVQRLVDDKGESLLFNLKKYCHALYRGNDSSSEEEKLFDLAISSVFHEAMIIRENCYQLEVYGPKVTLLAGKPVKTTHERKFLRETSRLLERARKRLSEGLKETHALLTQSQELMKDLLASYKDNGLLVRFLFEKEDLVEEVFGRGGLDEILSSMFKAGRLDALLLAARSYYKSGYYEKAAEMAQRALALSTTDELRFFYLFYLGLRDYYSGNYSVALESLREARDIGSHLPGQQEQLERIQAVFERLMAQGRPEDN